MICDRLCSYKTAPINITRQYRPQPIRPRLAGHARPVLVQTVVAGGDGSFHWSFLPGLSRGRRRSSFLTDPSTSPCQVLRERGGEGVIYLAGQGGRVGVLVIYPPDWVREEVGHLPTWLGGGW